MRPVALALCLGCYVRIFSGFHLPVKLSNQSGTVGDVLNTPFHEHLRPAPLQRARTSGGNPLVVLQTRRTFASGESV